MSPFVNYKFSRRFHYNKVKLEIEIILWTGFLPSIGILDDVLTVVHLGNLVSRGGILGLFVIPNPDEPGEPQANPLAGVHLAHCSSVDWGDAQVGTFDLPHLDWLKPVIRCQTSVIAVVRLGLVNQVIFEESSMLGKIFISEASANFTNTLVFLIVRIIASEQKTTITKIKLIRNLF